MSAEMTGVAQPYTCQSAMGRPISHTVRHLDVCLHTEHTLCFSMDHPVEALLACKTSKDTPVSPL